MNPEKEHVNVVQATTDLLTIVSTGNVIAVLAMTVKDFLAIYGPLGLRLCMDQQIDGTIKEAPKGRLYPWVIANRRQKVDNTEPEWLFWKFTKRAWVEDSEDVVGFGTEGECREAIRRYGPATPPGYGGAHPFNKDIGVTPNSPKK